MRNSFIIVFLLFLVGSVTAQFNNSAHFFGEAGYIKVQSDSSLQISEEITMDNLLPVFSLNVFGVFICIREAVKHMKKIGRGSIVNVSSEAARFGGLTVFRLT